MKKTVRILCAGIVISSLLYALIHAVAVIDPIDTAKFQGSTFDAIARLPDGDYLLGGGLSTGSQPWETTPGVTIYGGTEGENTYNIDGANLSDINQGTVVSFDFIEEVKVSSGGYEAEFGSVRSAILDYSAGGTGVYQLTKSGGNEFSGAVDFSYVDESLNDLTYDDEGTLWGAGTTFGAAGPMPVLGYFDDNGTFIQVDNPFEALGGFFNGVEFMGIGIAFGNTLPNGAPTKPLFAVSLDKGATWNEPSSLPWTYGTINTAQFLDSFTGWVGGETPEGGAFAYTDDGGRTWMKQMMPDSTYIWDLEIAVVDPSVCDGGKNWILGAALGTHYLDDGSKESIVYRYGGTAWEEMWRVPGFGGGIVFDYLGDGEIGIVQNGLDGTATFSRYAAHDFFGIENLICSMEIVLPDDEVHPDEPFTMQLAVRGPWGRKIAVDTVVWSTDWAELELIVDPEDPMLATLTASEPGDVTVTCSLPDFDLETSAVIHVKQSYD